MMQKHKIFELPFPSTACTDSPRLHQNTDLLLPMEFDDNGVTRSACLRFVKTRAFRFRAEIHCHSSSLWHIEDVYDTVCEVQGSDWVQELRSDSVPAWRDRWVMRHFIIYVDSYGCLEVVAESVVLDDASKKPNGI